MTDDSIATYQPSSGHLDDLRERCRQAVNHDHGTIEVSTDDLQWLLQLAPSAGAQDLADVYWDADGFYWTADRSRTGDGPYVDVDSAIVVAQAAGHRIRSVNMTRGTTPSRGTKASREPVIP